ncbi:MAG: VWA domain-containing protein [Acidobacteria bacterium]|nr:VWA domain-containing protein [Acidobacteriota bacterium]
MRHSSTRATGIAAIVALTGAALAGQQRDRQAAQDPFKFRTGVELVNVTATVTDVSGRFVSGLRKDDFTVFEDGRPQTISHFSTERVPVSLGIVLDTSGSMAGDKLDAAKNAIDRFLYDLLSPDDEIFLYAFSDHPRLVEPWTTDRRRLSRSLRSITARGGTAMYDAVAEAVPLAQSGRNRKKAILLISDGNDTNSQLDVQELKRLVRETEVLVYAIGIDGDAPTFTAGTPPRIPIPIPIPIPGRRPGGSPWPFPPQSPPQRRLGNERVNVRALREITDDSGGRTETIRSARDLDPATASVADELSKQYYLGYVGAAERDGRWHTIEVEVSNSRYKVRARRGYVAS